MSNISALRGYDALMEAMRGGLLSGVEAHGSGSAIMRATRMRITQEEMDEELERMYANARALENAYRQLFTQTAQRLILVEEILDEKIEALDRLEDFYKDAGASSDKLRAIRDRREALEDQQSMIGRFWERMNRKPLPDMNELRDINETAQDLYENLTRRASNAFSAVRDVSVRSAQKLSDKFAPMSRGRELAAEAYAAILMSDPLDDEEPAPQERFEALAYSGTLPDMGL